MEIRIATLEDRQAIADLASAFRNHLQRTEPTDGQFLQSVTQLLKADDAEFCLALEEGIPVGYVLQRFRYSMWAAGTEATIEDLFVEPAFRGKGAGRQLIEFALDRARVLACATVCLDTNENNVASTRIYTQLGFSAVSKRWEGRQIFYRLKLEGNVAAPTSGGPDRPPIAPAPVPGR
jgi:GNAT superfamily N-acetyltransferase